MPTWKAVLATIAWLLVAIFVGVVTAIVVTEILRAFGVVTSGESSYRVSMSVVWFLATAVVFLIPFVFRSRFVEQPHDEA